MSEQWKPKCFSSSRTTSPPLRPRNAVEPQQLQFHVVITRPQGNNQEQPNSQQQLHNQQPHNQQQPHNPPQRLPQQNPVPQQQPRQSESPPPGFIGHPFMEYYDSENEGPSQFK